MMPLTVWGRVLSWLAHLPVSLAYRIIWLSARLNLGSSRDVYRAMWNANLALPEPPVHDAPHERVGSGYDPDAFGYERQGRDFDAVCTTCRWKGKHGPDCPRKNEPWPTI